MASIVDLLPPEREVVCGGKIVKVKGLTLAHIGKLLMEFRKDVVYFMEATEGNAELFLLRAPELCRRVIAYALDVDEEEYTLVDRLPLSTQIEILQAAWEASVPDPKKLMGLVQSLIKAGNSAQLALRKD